MAMGTMQSSLPANNDNLDDDYYHQEDTVLAAAALEGSGSVLNEHYSFEEYIHRRGTYLARLPAYSNLPNACFIARRHADEIFDDEQQLLDVEIVRSRELEHEFDPLLPLPTTSNTATIDNFKTCPPRDTIYETEDGLLNKMSQLPKRSAGDTNSLASALSPMASDALSNQRPMQASYQQATATGANIPSVDSDLADLVTPGLQQHVTSSQSMVVQPTYHPSLGANFHAPQARMTPALATSQYIPSSQDVSHVAHPTSVNEVVATRNSMILRARNDSATGKSAPLNIPATSKPPQSFTSPAQKTFTPDPRVASMAKFGIVNDVKAAKHTSAQEPEERAGPSTLTGRGVGYAASEIKVTSNAPVATASNIVKEPTKTVEPAEPPQKRQMLARGIVSKPKTLTHESTVQQTKPSVKPAAVKDATPLISNSGKKVTTTKAQKHLESVIAGTALPKTKAEAQTAAKEHRQRLLAAHNKYKHISTRRAAKSTPDLLPYFFEAANFDTDAASVRCICGCVDEDGGELGDQMVQCESCEVWQHYACVLPGLSEGDVEKLGSYECTVCNPWARRYVLMGLRKNDGKVGVQQ